MPKPNVKTCFECWSYVAAAISLFACVFLMLDGPFPYARRLGDFILFQLWPGMGILGIFGFILYKAGSQKLKLIILLSIVGLIAAIPFVVSCMFLIFSVFAMQLFLVLTGEPFFLDDAGEYMVIIITALSVSTMIAVVTNNLLGLDSE